MNTGMMWQYDVNKPIRERVAEAVAYYRQKYGEPETVFVNPRLLEGHEVIVEGIAVKPMRLPISLLWIGVEDATRGVEHRSVELLDEAEAMS